MTEYEVVSLFHQIVTGANASLTNFLTVLMAMLVASYMAAGKLDGKTTGMILAVYSVFSLGMMNEIYSGYRDFAAVGMEMVRMGRMPGSSIAWHPNVVAGGIGLAQLPFVILAILVSAYASSMWFFFHMRGRHRGEATAAGEG